MPQFFGFLNKDFPFYGVMSIVNTQARALHLHSLFWFQKVHCANHPVILSYMYSSFLNHI